MSPVNSPLHMNNFSYTYVYIYTCCGFSSVYMYICGGVRCLCINLNTFSVIYMFLNIRQFPPLPARVSAKFKFIHGLIYCQIFHYSAMKCCRFSLMHVWIFLPVLTGIFFQFDRQIYLVLLVEDSFNLCAKSTVFLNLYFIFDINIWFNKMRHDIY